MSAMLARLAALRAKREAAAGPCARKVDPALAAAAAAAGAPTRGTWDEDYARRLRDTAADSDGDESDGDVVVLPPPVVRLDPVAQREKWRRDMRMQARRRWGVGAGVEADGRGFVLEKLAQDQEEVEGDGEGGEEVTIEIEGEIEDEDELLAMTEEVLEEEVDEENCEDEEGAVEKLFDAADADDEAGDDEGGGDEQEEGAESGDDAEPVTISVAVSDEALKSSMENMKDTPDHESELQEEPPKVATPTESSRPLFMHFPRRPPPSTRPNFVDDQAEDEDGDANDRDSDRDSDHEGEITAADALVPDDPEASPEPGAALFHRQWQECEEAAQLVAIAGGGRCKMNANRPRTDDNAMDLTEMVASGAVVAGNSGGGGDDDCHSVVGDHGGGDGSDGELMDLGRTRTENYVEEMFRMPRDEIMLAEGDADESADDTPKKEAEEARRTKAIALWKARQKRNYMSSGTLDDVDLSRCEFLEDDTNHKRDLYRNQIERACGISNSRDEFESRNTPRKPGTSNGSVDALGLRRDVGGVRAGSHSHSVPLQNVKNGTSRSGATDMNSKPEWERRKLCLERKEVHRRSGTSIGKWAFAAERSLIGGSLNNPSANATTSAAAVCVSVRRKRARGKSVSAAAAPAGIGAPHHIMKRPKKSSQGLLSILGSRPYAD